MRGMSPSWRGRLFRSLQSEHRMDARCETLLYVAALLHEIGLFVGVSGYHKHSHYLITHSELFGLNEQDQQLVAMIARYHRRAAPKPTHELFARLDRDNRVVVSQTGRNSASRRRAGSYGKPARA